MTEKAQSRLYIVASLACIVWLVQSTMVALGDGTMWSISNIFFSVALLLAIGWTGWNGISLMRKVDKQEEAEEEVADENVDDTENESSIDTSDINDTNRTNDASRS